jgi:hypothetical protein
MEDWVAGSMAVLGTLLVLAGATLIVVRTIATNEEVPGTDPAPPAVPPRPVPDREPDTVAEAAAEPAPARRRWRLLPLRQMGPANQLIAWGVVLLIIAALAVGAITFSISAAVGTQ